MTADEAYRRVVSQFPSELEGRFYSPGTSVGLGKGKIYSDLRFPLFDPDSQKYLTADGLGYVLTHECDVETENERLFNEDLLVCPIIPLQDLIAVYQSDLPGELLPAFLGNLGARLISRLIFVPAIPDALPFGGTLYLNQITNSHKDSFARATAVCAVTAYGLRHIETGIENHLLRPKDDRLAFAE